MIDRTNIDLPKSCIFKQFLLEIIANLEKKTILDQDFETDIQQLFQQVMEPSPLLKNTPSRTVEESIFQFIPLLREVFDFIEANYNQPITLNDVAQAVGYSPAYLTNLVRQQTGQSLYRWITLRRMIQAYFLLLETNQNVNQIAEQLGYQNVASFSRQFRQIYGKSPQLWRSEYSPCFKLKQTIKKELIGKSKKMFLKIYLNTL